VEVPWLRPSNLAGDSSPVIFTLIHAIERLAKDEDYHPDYIMLLQPNIPFRETDDIDNSVELLFEKSAESVISIYESPSHPYLSRKIDEDARLSHFLQVPIPEMKQERQNLPPAYSLNGAIYIVKTDVLMEGKTLYGDPTYAYVMPAERSIDIDTPWDLYIADLVMKDKLKRKKL
jgi:N-acylneuraminate cytidylyltransferase/CMP-N,N'-diacetyllegionaminic acid synthase